MFFYSFILIAGLIVISIIAWIEFHGLLSKIFKKNTFTNKIKKFFYKLTILIYLFSLVFFILIIESKNPSSKIFIFYPILVSILSDIGGLIIGKIFKGKKLTKISPKKTISGSMGSFIFSLFLIPFFISDFMNINFYSLLLITLLISLVSQFGDLFISYLKRKAKVKNTSDLLPGHGGILDRIDGIIFSIPFGFFLLNYLSI
jgi:phosphatidate cytidylyltransferase